MRLSPRSQGNGCACGSLQPSKIVVTTRFQPVLLEICSRTRWTGRIRVLVPEEYQHSIDPWCVSFPSLTSRLRVVFFDIPVLYHGCSTEAFLPLVAVWNNSALSGQFTHGICELLTLVPSRSRQMEKAEPPTPSSLHRARRMRQSLPLHDEICGQGQGHPG